MNGATVEGIARWFGQSEAYISVSFSLHKRRVVQELVIPVCRHYLCRRQRDSGPKLLPALPSERDPQLTEPQPLHQRHHRAHIPSVTFHTYCKRIFPAHVSGICRFRAGHPARSPSLP